MRWLNYLKKSVVIQVNEQTIDSNKVAFITCVNDEELYQEALVYLQNLKIPNDFTVEYLRVDHATSITDGYQEAMISSTAKYKVYMHQDCYIINKNFINDIIKLFKEDDDIGMIGMIGAVHMPITACWWQSKNTYGKVYDSWSGVLNENRGMKKNASNKCYQTVQAVDGLLMVTQYDVDWKAEFDGWHMYDASQSAEFLKTGYKVIVPKMEKPWCIHDCGCINLGDTYTQYLQLYIQTYEKVIFPQVTICIMVGNSLLELQNTIHSIETQTYKNIKVLVVDCTYNYEKIKPIFKSSNFEWNYYAKDDKLSTSVFQPQYGFIMQAGIILHNDRVKKAIELFLQEDNVAAVFSQSGYLTHNNEVELKEDYWTETIKATTIFNKDKFINNCIRHGLNTDIEILNIMFDFSLVDNFDIKDMLMNKREYIHCLIKLLEKGVYIGIPEMLTLKSYQSKKSEISKWNEAMKNWYYWIQEAYLVDKQNINFAKNITVWQMEYNDAKFIKDIELRNMYKNSIYNE